MANIIEIHVYKLIGIIHSYAFESKIRINLLTHEIFFQKLLIADHNETNAVLQSLKMPELLGGGGGIAKIGRLSLVDHFTQYGLSRSMDIS